jgi:DNA-binding transcriptional MocR family regulator
MLEENRKHYQKKMTKLIESLKKEGLGKYFDIPSGGFYVWLKTRKKLNDAIRKKLLSKKVDVVDGDMYFSNQSHGNYVRLSIANIHIAEIASSVKVIKKLLYEK